GELLVFRNRIVGPDPKRLRGVHRETRKKVSWVLGVSVSAAEPLPGRGGLNARRLPDFRFIGNWEVLRELYFDTWYEPERLLRRGGADEKERAIDRCEDAEQAE